MFTSSIAVYGSSPVAADDAKTTRPAPEDPYGIAKYAVERSWPPAATMFGLDYMIFRPHNVYGPRQNIGDRYRNVVGIFMNQILQGQPMTIFGDGTQTRAFSYIDDVAPRDGGGDRRAARRGTRCSTSAPTIRASLNDLAARVAAAMGVAPAIAHLPARHEVLHAHSSHAKMRARLRRPRDDVARRRPARDGRVGPAAGRAVQPGVRGHRDQREPAGRLAQLTTSATLTGARN